MANISGIVVPILTPFDKQGKLSEELVDPMVEFLGVNGIPSLFVGGSYGGFALLDLDERQRLNVASTKAAKKHNLKTLVNCASSNTRDTVQMVKEANNSGADAVCFMSPLYYSHSIYKEADLLRYAESIVKESTTPVYMYNNPRTTGFNASIPFIKKLSEIGISGIKDSSDSIERIAGVLHAISGFDCDFEYITGSSIALMVSLSLGSPAAMSGVAVAFPALNVSFYNAVRDNDRDKAIACYDRISRIREIMTSYGSRPISFYSLLRKIGIDSGYPREPWYALSDKSVDEMYARLKDISAFSPI